MTRALAIVMRNKDNTRISGDRADLENTKKLVSAKTDPIKKRLTATAVLEIGGSSCPWKTPVGAPPASDLTIAKEVPVVPRLLMSSSLTARPSISIKKSPTSAGDNS